MLFLIRSLLVLLCLVLTSCSPKKAPEQESWKETKPLAHSPLTIWIDPGHGGKDPGASNRKLKIQEKNLCLKTARFVQKKLLQMGYCAKLVRDKDEFISLDERIAKANSTPKSLLVSLHFNSAKNLKAEGLEIYYYSGEKNISSTNRLSKALAERIEKQIVKQIKIPSKGARLACFRVIKGSKVPSCLIEGGFLTNAKEAKKLSKNSYLQLLGYSIAEGIDIFCCDYFRTLEKL
jgi:N-acetylmuramoyl-L-alanine amidase